MASHKIFKLAGYCKTKLQTKFFKKYNNKTYRRQSDNTWFILSNQRYMLVQLFICDILSRVDQIRKR